MFQFLNRRVSITIALLFAWAWAVAWVPATHAQASTPPAVEITNGAITATVYLPDAAAGFYRGTRFDWAGVIGRLAYRGHTFYAPWFTKTDATVRDFVNDGVDVTAGIHTAMTGPAEEFSVLGFADAGKRTVTPRIGLVPRFTSTVLALEPFLALDIAPGAEYTWEYTYRYYTIP